MRLIDADELLKEMCDWSATPNDFKIIKKVIGNIPTAYDVDKVVEQLEEEREYSFANFYDYVEDCSPCLDTDDDYFHRGLERAIKIVKKGGKE